MRKSIRKLVGGGAAALALGGFFALIVSPLVAGAGVSNKVLPGTAVSSVALNSAALIKVPAKSTTKEALTPTATPTASCISAKQDLAAARAKDKEEDTAELAKAKSDPNFKANDAAEDATEKAAMKPLVDAVFSACASPTCVSAVNALKAAIEADRAEDASEKTAGTETTAGDAAEDTAEKAKLMPLFQTVRTQCAFGLGGTTTPHKSFGRHTFGTGTRTFTWSWSSRRR